MSSSYSDEDMFKVTVVDAPYKKLLLLQFVPDLSLTFRWLMCGDSFTFTCGYVNDVVVSCWPWGIHAAFFINGWFFDYGNFYVHNIKKNKNTHNMNI